MLSKIGEVEWTANEMRSALEEFSKVYSRRPLAGNEGGMSSSHLFLLWFMLRRLNPTDVIENGVWKGQGTWLIEQAVPSARIHCVDINWSNLVYKSPNATYSSTDFSKQAWEGVDRENTVVFFDDHVNALRRVKQSRSLGFRHLIFEDNYFPSNVSDLYTLKLAFANAGYKPKRNLRYYGGLLKGTRSDWEVKPNSRDSELLNEIVEVYSEQPPVFKLAETRWGTPWIIPTPEPLLESVTQPWQQVFFDEAKWYTWMAYVRLKMG